MNKKHILLIHGTWCSGNGWSSLAAELAQRGFTVHAPTLRHHGAPGTVDIWANAEKVAKVGLLDYVADLLDLVERMDSPPIIVGHSVGALIAQLLAARCINRGVILLSPAPGPGMFNMYPSMFMLWARYLPQWLLRRPMYPCSKNAWKRLICNTLPSEVADSYYATLCAESGRAYFEMALWFLDRHRAARVNYSAVLSPVLVVTGSKDKCTVPRIGRVTAKKYGTKGECVVIQGADHMVTVGPFLPATISVIDRWLTANGLGIGTHSV